MKPLPPPHLILGVDPGLTGAIAFYDPVLKSIHHVSDIPLNPKTNTIDLYQLSNLINGHSLSTALACVEDPSSMPGQGVVSMFTFGKVCGTINGIVASNNIPLFHVKPSVWKKILGLTSDKNLSRAMASQMFPKQADLFKRKKDDGRAEAALLAFFGTRFLYL